MKLKVKTKDSFGEQYENIFLAKKDINKLGTKYSYVDENTNVRVFILKDKVQIIREGEITSKQLLKKNEITDFLYQTSHMNRNFKIFTKDLIIANNKISAVYSILEGKETVNELTLEIYEL